MIQGGRKDLILQDMIIDHMSEKDYRFIEDDAFWQDVHELLEEAILNVTSDGSGSVPDYVTRKL